MKWAVIGASSFSGKSFCRYLRARGEEPLELSRPTYDLRSSMPTILSALREAEATHVVNFAALNVVADSWIHYRDYYRTNVVAISRLAMECEKLQTLERFVQISTPEVYGTTRTFLKEDAPYNPSTPYAVSRAAADMHLAAMFRMGGFPVVFTRSVNVYGPGQQPYRVIPKTVLKILRGNKLGLEGGGKSTRSFIHIDDVSESVYLVGTRGTPGQIYHTSTAQQISIRDLVLRICGLMGKSESEVVEEVAERPGKDMAYQLDSSKIRTQLGWRDRIDLLHGLKPTVDWFRERAEDYAGSALEYQHKG